MRGLSRLGSCLVASFAIFLLITVASPASAQPTVRTESGDTRDKFGHGVISRLPDRIVFSSAENQYAAFTFGTNPGGVPIGIPVYFAVTFNDNGAFFNAFDRSSGKELSDGPYRGVTIQAQVLILVHELAHVLGLSDFKHNDFMNDVFQSENNSKVQQNCGRLVGGIR